MSGLYKNKTFLYDMDSNSLYMGNYKPRPSAGLTAHARLSNAFGLETPSNGGPSLVGGYFDRGGNMVWNSGTVQGRAQSYGQATNGLYQQFGVHPSQTNPHVYYGSNCFRYGGN
jgi:hypothetical protein